MQESSPLISSDIEQYLKLHEKKTLLRFITCGSVDDGKSTLIGRLLFESKMIFEDQLQALERDSKKMGTQGEEIDFALLVDGLASEREQGITIDVAYRYFTTSKRKFIVADTPGHEQYTRNMVTAASTADLAIVLIDARKGVLTQTKRHSFLAHLNGVKKILVAVNKMDLIDYDEIKFRQIESEYLQLAEKIGIKNFQTIPLSALKGENILSKTDKMKWYSGPYLMEFLENVEIDQDRMQSLPMRMPVQWVNRPNQDFRGFCGTIVSGEVVVGQKIRVLPSSKESTVKEIVTKDGNLQKAVAGQAITLTLNDEIDISRGDIITPYDQPTSITDQFESHLVWMTEDSLHPGRSYWLKTSTKTVLATVTRIKYQINVNTLEQMPAAKLDLNAVAVCNFSLNQPIAFDPYIENHATGGFILIDRFTNNTVAAGMIHFALRRSENILPQHFDIDKKTRSGLNFQKPCVLWFTGLSGSGKSTIANALEQKLFALGNRTYVLDGDNLRHGLCRDLGFTETDRVENIRRASEAAKLLVDAGLIVMVTLISPFRKDRMDSRLRFQEGEFIEIFVDTSLEVCETRDTKGLYKKARAGQIKNFTGFDSPYEAPNSPELHFKTSENSVDEIALKVLNYLTENKIIGV